MNRLPKEKRIQVIASLAEGMSMSATARTTGVSFNAVARLLDLAGVACARHHDLHVRGIKGRRNIQCDELWSFVYAKDKSLEWATPWDDAGSAYTFTAIDADSKLLVSYLVAMSQDLESATEIMKDLRGRLEKRPKLTSDSLPAYKQASKKAFGKKARLSQIRKGEDTDHSTAYVERHNLTIRNFNKRYMRKTIAFSRKLSRHIATTHLFAVYYNFCWIHSTLQVTPAMEAGIDDKLRDYEWIVDLIDEARPKPKKPGPKKGTKYRPRKSSGKVRS